jgi:hypothetical protein
MMKECPKEKERKCNEHKKKREKGKSQMHDCEGKEGEGRGGKEK